MAENAVAARFYNAAEDLIGRNLTAGRGGKKAVIDSRGSYTYQELADRIAAGLQDYFAESGLPMT